MKVEAMQDKQGRWMTGYKDTQKIKYIFHYYYDNEQEAKCAAKKENKIMDGQK